MGDLKVEVGQRGGLAHGGPGVVAPAQHQRCSPPPVACGDDAVGGEQQHRARALDALLHMLDAAHPVVTLGDEQSHSLGLVGAAHRHLVEVLVVLEHALLDSVEIAYLGHSDDGKLAQAAVEQDGLRVGVADDAYARRCGGKLVEVALKLVAKISVLKVVDRTHKLVRIAVVGSHAAATGAKVRVIVGAIVQLIDTRLFTHDSEEASHVSFKYLKLK